jgi:hypothetical protein
MRFIFLKSVSRFGIILKKSHLQILRYGRQYFIGGHKWRNGISHHMNDAR